MPTIRLTQAAVDKIKPPATGRVVHWDRLLPGFGLRVTAKHARSWVVTFRVNRKFIWETLGTVEMIPKVDEARDMARESILKARRGINPVAERKQRVQQEAAAANDAKANTLSVVVERYLERHAKTRQNSRSLAETLRQFNKDVLPRWGNRNITSISEKDIRRLRDEIHERAPIQANRVVIKLKTLFAWATRERYVAVDPTLNVDPITEEKSRDRWLADPEVAAFWNACDQSGWPYGKVFQLLLLTAQRRDEVATMEWGELDLANGIWLLPAAKSKNRDAHEIHLAPLAVEILASLPRIGNRWVFTTNGEKPVSGWSTAKAKIDTLMGDTPSWRLHDLRRTAATGMARLGVRAEVADKVLNHSGGSVVKGVARIYNRFEYAPERRAALETWASHVESLVRPVRSNVVVMADVRS
jgi:integrase